MSYPTPALPANLSYEEAVNLSMELVDFERGLHSPGHSTFHLERMTHLAEFIGNPHLYTRSIHVISFFSRNKKFRSSQLFSSL